MCRHVHATWSQLPHVSLTCQNVAITWLRHQAVEALLAAGADASVRDSLGCTALLYAARTGDASLFSLLAAQGPSTASDMADRDTRGYTLLHHAVEGGNVEVVKGLLDRPGELCAVVAQK